MSNPRMQGREVLPIPHQPDWGLITYDAKDPETSFPPIVPVRPPKDAPNVLIVLLDDVGFGASSAFGGPCHTPTAEKLAGRGLKYNRLHSTALCAPSRRALLTGRNHHSAGMGAISEQATSAPGNDGLLTNNKASLPLILTLNGYSTAHIGKCHEVPPWQSSPMGPFDSWPSGGTGNEYFYGFIGGEDNQWNPALYENLNPVEPDKTPEEGYHLTEDLADKAIAWISTQKALMPDKPFYMYFAPGATHAPHHVPAEWADKYKGKFSKGWDSQREETFARQKELGVIPQDAKLTERSAGIPAWDDMDEKLKPVLEREMEIYAGFLEHVDYHAGRVIDTLEELEILDDTLILFIIGDNGASAEGTQQGAYNEMANFNGRPDLETVDFMVEKIDGFGSPDSYNHYAVGWAHAMNTPYQWTKQVASHWGGTRNGTIMHWPNGIKAKNEIREQFCHFIDIAPTILEAVGLPEPKIVNGVLQSPMEGTSMLYSFDDVDATERHDLQYFEMMGNRGIYFKGWSAVTKHRTPWELTGTPPALDDDVWELYDGSKDWTQANDLSKEMPEKLAYLQRLWMIEAVKYGVLPIDDRGAERLNADLAGRPQLIKGKTQMLYAGMGRLSENSCLSIKNKSWSLTAEIVVPKQGAEGVVISQGGKFGGWVMFAKDGKLKYASNMLGINLYTVASEDTIPEGKHQVRMEFAYDGGGVGKGGTATLYVDGKQVGEGRVEETQAMLFSADETTDVGRDTGTPVSPEYAGASKFTGKIGWVQIDLGDDSDDHMVDPEHALSVAMSLQ
jgi:arylsulfatase A-like enzyme